MLSTFLHPAVYVELWSNSMWPVGSLQLEAAWKGWSRRCLREATDQAASSRRSNSRAPFINLGVTNTAWGFGRSSVGSGDYSVDLLLRSAVGTRAGC